MTKAINDFYNITIIGAGFFGVSIAEHLAKKYPDKKILIVDCESEPLNRASKNNQARIHQGYHYPRSVQTAFGSSVNYDRFKKKWPSSVYSQSRALYGVAKNRSKVSASQFEALMTRIGAPVNKLSHPEDIDLFSENAIESVFEVVEEVFNYRELKSWSQEVLDSDSIEFLPDTTVKKVRSQNGVINVSTENGIRFTSEYVLNVTYGGLDSISGLSEDLKPIVEHKVTEMSLVQVPLELLGVSITIIDGPFFSLMPYPAEPGLMTLSHVNYSHSAILDQGIFDLGPIPDSPLGISNERFNSMRKDASLFVPSIEKAEEKGSIKEVKTLIRKSKLDDSRPILFYKHSIENCYSILGSKLDNIFDILERIDKEFD